MGRKRLKGLFDITSFEGLCLVRSERFVSTQRRENPTGREIQTSYEPDRVRAGQTTKEWNDTKCRITVSLYQPESNSILIIWVKLGRPLGHMTTPPAWKAAPPSLTA